MSPHLSPTLIEKYHQEGICFPIRVMSPQEAIHYRAKLEAFEVGKGSPISGIENKKTHLLFTWANELIRHPPILDAVESVIGPNILCWASEFFTKAPGSKNFVSWHQDATYWGMSNDDIVTAWLALSESNIESGCMRVILETHQAQIQHKETANDANLLSRGQEVSVAVDETQAVDVILKPGEISLHHVLLFHSSKPNVSKDRRIGFAIRYIPTHVRKTDGQDSATLVRGQDNYHHFELEPSPSADMAPAMVKYHKNVCDRMVKLLYQGSDKQPY